MNRLRTTHTVVELKVSQAVYDEIARKLREAGYHHCFEITCRQEGNELFYTEREGGLIDMTGIGLITEGSER